MNRSLAIAILKRHEHELRALGVEHLSVFGSTATGSETEESDIDVAVRMASGPRGFKRLERLDAIRACLSRLLSRPVDVVEEPARSERVQRAIERDRVPAF